MCIFRFERNRHKDKCFETLGMGEINQGNVCILRRDGNQINRAASKGSWRKRNEKRVLRKHQEVLRCANLKWMLASDCIPQDCCIKLEVMKSIQVTQIIIWVIVRKLLSKYHLKSVTLL